MPQAKLFWGICLIMPLLLVAIVPAGIKKPQRQNGIYYLEVSGTPLEMGQKHGTVFKKEIHEQIAAYRKEVAEYFGNKEAKDILDYVINKSKFICSIKKSLPEVYEEMEGIAEGAGVPVKDILLLNMYEEVYEGAPEVLKIKPKAQRNKCKCTTFCLSRKGLPNLNAQNLDYTPNLKEAQLITHYKFKDGLQILLYTFIGQVGGIGVNNRGLSQTCNTLPEGSKRENDGLGSGFVTRGLLKQISVKEAIKWLRKAPYFGALNYVLVDFDRAVMVESSPKGGLEVLPVPKKAQFLAHTNHILKLKDRKHVPDLEKVADNTYQRLKTANNMLKGIAGQVSVDGIKKVLTTVPINNHMPEWLTLQSIIMVHERDNLRMYASAGDDPKRGWNVYRFK